MKKVLPGHVEIAGTRRASSLQFPKHLAHGEAGIPAGALRVDISSGISVVTATNPKD